MKIYDGKARKVISFDVSDPEQKKAYEMLEKVKYYQSRFISKVINEFFDSANITENTDYFILRNRIKEYISGEDVKVAGNPSVKNGELDANAVLQFLMQMSSHTAYSAQPPTAIQNLQISPELQQIPQRVIPTEKQQAITVPNPPRPTQDARKQSQSPVNLNTEENSFEDSDSEIPSDFFFGHENSQSASFSDFENIL